MRLAVLITIEEFRRRIATERHALISELQALTGRYGSEEAEAWSSSLSTLSNVFQSPAFQPLHLYFGSRGNLALEYQLPASSSWCDVVLLGRHQSTPSAVILELKHWTTRADLPGRYEGLIERQGMQDLHPSDQVRGYTEYCRRFHSAVADYEADVHGCSLLTRDRWAGAYAEPPNDALVALYPLFTIAPEDVQRRFPAYFGARLTKPDEAFANAFAEGGYRQNRGFVAQIGAQILDPKSHGFELLDNQRIAFAVCRAIIEELFIADSTRAPRKRVVIVKGPPGSGKSVIAARLWASLVTNADLPEGNVIFATTSLSQNSNWSDLFRRSSGLEGAAGVVRKATAYTPITTHRFGELRRRPGTEAFKASERWRENLQLLRALGEPFRNGAGDDDNLISIVDEAHGLINPEHPEGRGQFGFATALGPQAYHIIRSSVLSVFLLDPLQAFRERENTTIDDLREWSRELGVGEPEEISLEGAQFRCGGSTEFVSWVEGLLAGEPADANRSLARLWRAHVVDDPYAVAHPERVDTRRVADTDHPEWRMAKSSNVIRPTMDVLIFDNPEPWEAQLRRRHASGHSVRILSSYSRVWKTEGAADPHSLPPALMDFHETYNADGEQRVWSRIWNFVPRGGDYTWYVTGHPGGRIASDPLCEVGCPYAVRGFDYDYVGIAWLNDLLWRHGEWHVDPFAVEERGIRRLVLAARREAGRGSPGRSVIELLARVCQAYRILFTRALKGVYVWIPDAETRAHVIDSIWTDGAVSGKVTST